MRKFIGQSDMSTDRDEKGGDPEDDALFLAQENVNLKKERFYKKDYTRLMANNSQLRE